METQSKKLVVGLTGGIGSGKTTVANLFQALGIDVFDADVYAREVVEPGTEIYQAIVNKFGKSLIQADGNLNRKKLREISFNDTSIRKWLESMIHPQVRQKMQHAVDHSQSPYCLLVIPLLIESLPNPLVDQILVVTANVETRINRIIERDQCSSTLAKKMIGAQLSDEQRLAKADKVINNNASIDQLTQAVDDLHHSYLAQI